MKSKTCHFEAQEGKLKILAPSIGRVRLSIKPEDLVMGGQVIGQLQLLNQNFALKLNEECQGQVSFIKNTDAGFMVGYGDIICELSELKKHDGQKTSAKLAEKYIDSPLDGLFYLSASPESEPYIKVGDEVAPGQILGLIEVMKCFYPLNYQGSSKAKILSIKVTNQSPVTIGTHLFGIS